MAPYLQAHSAQLLDKARQSEHFKLTSLLALIAILILTTAISSTAIAQQYPADSDQGVPGEEIYQACGFCHGAQGQGRQRLDAPPIAGLQAWYVERQLRNFDAGIRGEHAEDLPGAQMTIISPMLRNDATIINVSAYVATLEPGGPPVLRGRGDNAQPEPLERSFEWNSKYASLDAPKEGDASAGQQIFSTTCTTCHGANAKGNEQFSAPNLTDAATWYLERELQYFRDGVRGADPKDIYGQQMAAFAKLLKDEQAIADVVAYIDSL